MFLAGKDPRRGDQPFLYVMPHAGGWGGFEGGDGEDGLINNVNGGFKDYPVEVFEVKYPALIRGYGFRPDTGGPGRFRGGCGLFRTFEVEPDAYLYLWLERSVTPAWGLFGGRDAVGPDVIVNPGRPDERRMLKVNAPSGRRGLRRRRSRPAAGEASAIPTSATPSRSGPTCSTGSSAARPPSATTPCCSTPGWLSIGRRPIGCGRREPTRSRTCPATLTSPCRDAYRRTPRLYPNDSRVSRAGSKGGQA